METCTLKYFWAGFADACYFLLLFVKEDFHGYYKGIILAIQEIQRVL